MAEVETQAEKVAKLQKKLKKAQKAGDEEAVAKWQKKLSKLQDEPAHTVEQNGSSGKQQGKKSKRQADSEQQPEQQPEEQAAPAKKKAKQTNGQQASKDDAEVDLHTLAEVGDAALAKAGKRIVKDLYKQHAELLALSSAEVQAQRTERAITLEGRGCNSDRFRPCLMFEHTNLPANILSVTSQFQHPSPIQAQCWPIILSGRDLIGIAATGSGKTLGFGLPMMAHIAAQKQAGVVGVKGKGPYAAVMAPTRELALQINQVLVEAGQGSGVRCVCVYGGVPKRDQVEALRRGVEVLVGTPGRLEDLMQEGACKLAEVTYLVLDEADRMLDLGFEPHIRAISNTIRSDRQTLMFSATWPSAVQKLASLFLSHPVKVTIGSQDLAASHSITQHVEVMDPYKRDERLLQLLQQHHSSRKNRIIIFVLYKKEAPRVEGLLARNGWKCVAIHGDISQGQRTAAVESFKSGQVPLLIATDVAARGLDIPDVEVVINYSFPLTTEDYVHRIGRTGRAGKSGVAVTFFSAASDKPRAGELINVLREAGQRVPEDLLKFGTAVKKKESKVYGSHFKDVDHTAKATKVTFDDDE